MRLIESFERSDKLAAKLNVPNGIHHDDFIYRHLERKWKQAEQATSAYYQQGRYSADLAKEFVDEIIRVRQRMGQQFNIDDMLDFASGYGCVARHLGNVFPGTKVTACDIHSEAVRFNESLLNLPSILSSDSPEELKIGSYDVIISLSFFSHMPLNSYERWLNALTKSLKPGGALIFTANGHVTKTIAGLNIDVNDQGFGFIPQSEQQDLDKQTYGTTISLPKFVFPCIERCAGVRLALFREAVWWNIQDVYICIRDK